MYVASQNKEKHLCFPGDTIPNKLRNTKRQKT